MIVVTSVTLCLIIVTLAATFAFPRFGEWVDEIAQRWGIGPGGKRR